MKKIEKTRRGALALVFGSTAACAAPPSAARELTLVADDEKLADAVLLRGTSADKKAFFYGRNATVVALEIDGKKVTKTNEVEVRGPPGPRLR